MNSKQIYKIFCRYVLYLFTLLCGRDRPGVAKFNSSWIVLIRNNKNSCASFCSVPEYCLLRFPTIDLKSYNNFEVVFDELFHNVWNICTKIFVTLKPIDCWEELE